MHPFDYFQIQCAIASTRTRLLVSQTQRCLVCILKNVDVVPNRFEWQNPAELLPLLAK